MKLTQDLGMRLSESLIRYGAVAVLGERRLLFMFYWVLSHRFEAGDTDFHNMQSGNLVYFESGIFRVGARVFGQG